MKYRLGKESMEQKALFQIKFKKRAELSVMHLMPIYLSGVIK